MNDYTYVCLSNFYWSIDLKLNYKVYQIWKWDCNCISWLLPQTFLYTIFILNHAKNSFSLDWLGSWLTVEDNTSKTQTGDENLCCDDTPRGWSPEADLDQTQALKHQQLQSTRRKSQPRAQWLNASNDLDQYKIALLSQNSVFNRLKIPNTNRWT